MSEANKQQLPSGWVKVELSAIAQINPPLDRCIIKASVPVSFVPMRAVEPEGGGILRPEVSTYGAVKQGYTAFIPGDVIMAKITPCMENGKTCVVPNLPGAACFGSTEFHVVRTETGIDARWIANFLLQHSTRHTAQRQMMGGVGQMRVPSGFLESLKVPVPPTSEQQRILDETDELLSDLDAGVAALERVQAKLKHYRAAVLKAAVEGALTAEWRDQHPTTEPASALLTRILAERRRRWEETQLSKFKANGQEPPKNWKTKYKEPVKPETAHLAILPDGWCWASIEQISVLVTDGDHNPPKRVKEGVPHLTAKNVKNLKLNNEGCSFLSQHNASRVFRRYHPNAGDLIVTCVGTVGRTAIVPDGFEFSPDRNLAAIRFSSAGPSVNYVQYYLESPRTQVTLMSASGSTAQPHLYLGDLRCLSVALPSAAEQEAIIEAVEDQLSVIEHLDYDIELRVKSAHVLRQSILRHAFTGQLVPQDPTDEPASELLKRIGAQREELFRLAQAAKLAKRTGPKMKPETNPTSRLNARHKTQLKSPRKCATKHTLKKELS